MRSALLALAVVACGGTSSTPPDPCAVTDDAGSGDVELGLGSAFATITDGETVQLQLGGQGLWMFVIDVRTLGLAVGSDSPGALSAVIEESGTIVSLFPGCHPESFVPLIGGGEQLANAYLLPFDPTLEASPDGKQFTLHVSVGDLDGRTGSDEHTVIAHVPG